MLVSDPERKRVIVTHKKTLLNSELPLITSYESAQPEMLSHGVILHVQVYDQFQIQRSKNRVEHIN